jgi:hypothetical protein
METGNNKFSKIVLREKTNLNNFLNLLENIEKLERDKREKRPSVRFTATQY